MNNPDLDNQIGQAWELYHIKRYEAALNKFNFLLTKNVGIKTQILHGKALCLSRLGQNKEARQIYENLANQTKMPGLMLDYAHLLQRMFDYDGAKTIFAQIPALIIKFPHRNEEKNNDRKLQALLGECICKVLSSHPNQLRQSFERFRELQRKYYHTKYLTIIDKKYADTLNLLGLYDEAIAVCKNSILTIPLPFRYFSTHHSIYVTYLNALREVNNITTALNFIESMLMIRFLGDSSLLIHFANCHKDTKGQDSLFAELVTKNHSHIINSNHEGSCLYCSDYPATIQRNIYKLKNKIPHKVESEAYDLLNQYTQLLLMQGEPLKALPLTEVLISISPDQMEAYITQLNILIESGNQEQSESLYRDMLKKSPNTRNIYLAVNAFKSLKQFDLITSTLTQAMKIFPNDERITLSFTSNLFAWGSALANGGNIAEAKEKYTQAFQVYLLAKSIPNASYHVALAYAHFLVEIFNKIPEIALHDINLQAEHSVDLIKAAKSTFESTYANEVYATHIEVHMSYAGFLEYIGEYELEEKILLNAVAKFPNRHNPYMGYAFYLRQRGQNSLALKNYEHVVNFFPDCIEGLLNYTGLCIDQGLYEEVIKVEATIIKRFSLNAHLFLNIGIAYLEQGNLTKAKECAERALMIDPKFAGAEALLGHIAGYHCRSQKSTKLISKSVNHFNQAYKLMPKRLNKYDIPEVASNVRLIPPSSVATKELTQTANLADEQNITATNSLSPNVDTNVDTSKQDQQLAAHRKLRRQQIKQAHADNAALESLINRQKNYKFQIECLFTFFKQHNVTDYLQWYRVTIYLRLTAAEEEWKVEQSEATLQEFINILAIISSTLKPIIDAHIGHKIAKAKSLDDSAYAIFSAIKSFDGRLLKANKAYVQQDYEKAIQKYSEFMCLIDEFIAAHALDTQQISLTDSFSITLLPTQRVRQTLPSESSVTSEFNTTEKQGWRESFKGYIGYIVNVSSLFTTKSPAELKSPPQTTAEIHEGDQRATSPKQ